MCNHKIITKPIISSLVLLALVILTISPASAYSAGANLAGTGTDGGGGWLGTWNNTIRITANDGSYSTTNNIGGGTNSHTLTATGFGFNIDTSATITGISVSIDRYASGSNVRDQLVQLVKAGAPAGVNNAITGSDWPTTPGGIHSYTPSSPASPLWGTTWTPAQINATDFGMVLQARNVGGGGSNRMASVDYISITVSYTLPPTLSVANSPVTYNDSPQAATVTASVAGSAISDIKYNGSSTVPTNAGNYAITADFTPTDTGNYSTLNDAPAGNFIIEKATPTLSVTNSPVTYSGTQQSATISASVLGSSVSDIKYDTSSIIPTDAGTYTVTGDFTPTDTTNYTILNDAPAGNFVMHKRVVTVTADTNSKTYGDADPVLTYQITSGSLASGDSFSGGLSRAAGQDVGPYAILQNDLALSANYDLTYIGANLTISTRPVTITADTKSKTYGDVDPALTYAITSGSLSFSDTFSGDLTRDTGEDVGDYNINQGTLGLSSNYDLSYIGADLSITTRPITVTADTQNKTYGDADPALSYQVTSGSLVGSDAFSGELDRDTGETVGSSPYAITQGSLALSANYDLSYVGSNLTIIARPITVKAEPKSKKYGDADPTLSYQITSGSLAFSDTFSGELSHVSGEDIGPYPILQNDLALSSDYNLSFVGDNLSIVPRPITITADTQNKTFGDVDPDLSFQITSGSLVGSDAFSGELSRVVGEDVGPYAIQQNTVALSSNYDLTYFGADLSITTRPITIAADTQNKTFGDVDPDLSFQITSGSLVGSDAFSGELSRVVGEDVGPYAIQQNTVALSSNYDLSYIGADLSITTRPITITADTQNKTYGDADPDLSFQITYGTLVGSDAFSGELIRVEGEDVGPYAIQQNTVALSSNYDLTYFGADLSITPRRITVTADIQNKTYGDSDPALSYQITSGSLAFSDGFAGELIRDSGEDVGDYGIYQGTLGLSPNYDLTYYANLLTVGVRPVEVTAYHQARAYGEIDPALSYFITTGSLAFSDAFTGDLERDTGENVGDYSINQGTLTLSSNYDLTYVGDFLTIGVRPVEVTAYHQTRAYGEIDPALSYHISSGSLAFSDAFTGDLERDTGENVGDYSINQGTLVLSSNYNLVYVGDVLTVTPRAITVTADPKDKLSGQIDPVLTYQITSGALVAGDNFTGSIARDPGEIIGTYAITQGSLALSSNYELTFLSANLTINSWFQVFLPIVLRP